MWQRRPDSGTVARLRQRPNSCIPNSGDAPVLPPPKWFQRFGCTRAFRSCKLRSHSPRCGGFLSRRFRAPRPSATRPTCFRIPIPDLPPSPLFVTIHIAFAAPEERDTGSESEPIRRKSAARSRNRFHKPAAPGEAIAPQHRAHNDLRALLSCCRTAYCTICPSCTFRVLFAFVRNACASARKASFLSPAFQKFESELNHTTDKHAIRYSFRRYGSIPDMFNQLIIK